MKVKAANTKIVVKQEKVATEEDKGGFVVYGDQEPYYARGKVLDCKYYYVDLYKDKTVIYPKEKGNSVGFEFPSDVVVIDVEDIHAVIEEDDE